jgi:hypothetical protein
VNPVVQLKVASNPAYDLTRALKNLTRRDVLVGVTEATAQRKKEATAQRKKGQVTNAMLAYVHDNGSPLAHIPPRPFMQPGIMNAKDDIAKYFGEAGKAALDGKPELMTKALTAAGLSAQKSIRKRIQTGPFTPLKPATIRARKSKHKSRSNTSVTPLIDTSQMLQSISFEIRDK